MLDDELVERCIILESMFHMKDMITNELLDLISEELCRAPAWEIVISHPFNDTIMITGLIGAAGSAT